ncbi:ParB/Srx family N-terminal domain-containing protein [Paracoccus aestuariivivens]|uniref:ParB-like N-terminal domain-containing protein n=1 Tax=Paracoccus aestuariivivens TaxID=1820333 RepID=A0A6L6JDJ1_9RHOB|nr:ParB/Srx family N-terminal domain-containing protein [Paracoccus aestuariivivens]MTH79586.1 hypothetical protein [Paracoccus aestuariivivens]
MNEQSRITVDATRFPLAQLVLSTINPRQHVEEAEVAELAESIWTAGLIQNLAGIETEAGEIEIVAGGRRLRALQFLAARHDDLAQTHPELANPPVRIAPDVPTAQAWAVAENAARRDLLGYVSKVSFDGMGESAVCMFQAACRAYPKSWRWVAWNMHLRGGYGIVPYAKKDDDAVIGPLFGFVGAPSRASHINMG